VDDIGDSVVAGAALSRDDVAHLFDRYHADVWRYLCRLGGREVADELAGEVFARAWAVRVRYDPERGAARAWLFGIATNLVRQHFRSERRARKAFQRVRSLAATSTSEFDQIDDRDELEQLRQRTFDAIADCDADDRALIVMAAWEALSYSEIAAALGLPIGTVRSRLARLRARLRSAVDPRGSSVTTGESS
jgi:RNA polymerase sigma-70 factor (ECF subfamily)